MDNNLSRDLNIENVFDYEKKDVVYLHDDNLFIRRSGKMLIDCCSNSSTVSTSSPSQNKNAYVLDKRQRHNDTIIPLDLLFDNNDNDHDHDGNGSDNMHKKKKRRTSHVKLDVEENFEKQISELPLLWEDDKSYDTLDVGNFSNTLVCEMNNNNQNTNKYNLPALSTSSTIASDYQRTTNGFYSPKEIFENDILKIQQLCDPKADFCDQKSSALVYYTTNEEMMRHPIEGSHSDNSISQQDFMNQQVNESGIDLHTPTNIDQVQAMEKMKLQGIDPVKCSRVYGSSLFGPEENKSKLKFTEKSDNQICGSNTKKRLTFDWGEDHVSQIKKNRAHEANVSDIFASNESQKGPTFVNSLCHSKSTTSIPAKQNPELEEEQARGNAAKSSSAMNSADTEDKCNSSKTSEEDTCKPCGRTQQEKEEAGVIRCVKCSETLPTNEEYIKHLTTAHELKSFYQCKHLECGKVYTTKEGLRLHVLNVHLKCRENICPNKDCQKSFARQTDLRLHMLRMHCKERPFRCTEDGCNKSFACKVELKRHQNSHERRKQKMNEKKRKEKRKE